jgi:hypothetical protein
MSQNTASTNAAIVPEIWSARFYEILMSKLPFVGSIDESYSGEISNLGDTVHISSIPEFSAAAELGEGLAGSDDDVTITSQALVINKRTYKDYIVTKKAELQSLPFMDKLRDRAVYAVQKRMQAVIIAAIVPDIANAIAYDSLTTLALADILEAKELLDAADVPESDRYCVLGSAQCNDLFNILGFTSRDFIPAGSPLTSGAINTPVAGFDIRMTTEVGNTSYWVHPSFMTMAVQDNMSVNAYDLGVNGIRGSRVNVDLLWGLKQLDDKRVVTIS